jgi:phosphatidylserine decarboxylase
MSKTISHVDKNPKELHPVLREFKQVVEESPRLWMLFNTMFEQVPRQKEYLKDPTGQTTTVRDFDHLLALLNHVITTAPAWTDAGHSVGLVGVPINALLDWPMGTSAGFTVFQDPTVNAQLKKVLDVWNQFLSSPESAEVLGTDKEGWFGETGVKSIEHVGNLGKTNRKFEDMFVCDPSAKHHGFKSWDDFVSRHATS